MNSNKRHYDRPPTTGGVKQLEPGLGRFHRTKSYPDSGQWTSERAKQRVRQLARKGGVVPITGPTNRLLESEQKMREWNTWDHHQEEIEQFFAHPDFAKQPWLDTDGTSAISSWVDSFAKNRKKFVDIYSPRKSLLENATDWHAARAPYEIHAPHVSGFFHPEDGRPHQLNVDRFRTPDFQFGTPDPFIIWMQNPLAAANLKDVERGINEISSLTPYLQQHQDKIRDWAPSVSFQKLIRVAAAKAWDAKHPILDEDTVSLHSNGSAAMEVVDDNEVVMDAVDDNEEDFWEEILDVNEDNGPTTTHF